MECRDAIFTRRSIRRFSDYFVTDDELKEILEAARLAPSWANTQTWEFIVVRDRQTIEQIVGAYWEKNPATKCSLAASVLIACCARTGVAGIADGKPFTKFDDWHMFDLGMAVQNLCLRAHDLGLGTVVVGLIHHDRCREILQLGEGREVIVVVPVGKPAVAAKETPPRKPLSDFVFLNHFGNSF